MLKNLEEALSAKKITRSQVASVLGYTRYATITDKLEGKSKFSFDEALKLKKVFFPEYDLEFLFKKDDNYKTKQPA
ncbi:XRE family transcriptional regulator [Enterococcus faecalis]|nr:XRE family transcriptional regulator [Enterococcus faecalis]